MEECFNGMLGNFNLHANHLGHLNSSNVDSDSTGEAGVGPEIQYFQQLPGEGMLEAGELPFEPKGFKECFSCSSIIARNKVPFLLNNIKMNRRTISVGQGVRVEDMDE